MSTQRDDRERLALLQGTLDLLILRTLLLSPEHGQGIARTIQQRSDEAILVEHGSRYPALQRLEAQGLVRADWGVSENGRRARYYELTARGRRSEEHTSELQSPCNLVCRLLLEKKKRQPRRR